MNYFFRFWVLPFFFLTTSATAGQLECSTSSLHADWQPWSQSPDFSTLIFEGEMAHQAFRDLGEPTSQYFSVILRNEWCQFLQDAVLCETPKEALAEIEIADHASSTSSIKTLRYFSMILNYKADGWAFLKIRAKRMDSQPPVLFHTQLSEGSCRVTP
ncbi:MAG: hypothetical protein EBQ85_06200 [Proteobacteria bacterium]|nr:hypothetical protein [Pseudomonadota bacterium]